jgi:hypothetical protein
MSGGQHHDEADTLAGGKKKQFWQLSQELEESDGNLGGDEEMEDEEMDDRGMEDAEEECMEEEEMEDREEMEDEEDQEDGEVETTDSGDAGRRGAPLMAAKAQHLNRRSHERLRPRSSSVSSGKSSLELAKVGFPWSQKNRPKGTYFNSLVLYGTPATSTLGN